MKHLSKLTPKEKLFYLTLCGHEGADMGYPGYYTRLNKLVQEDYSITLRESFRKIDITTQWLRPDQIIPIWSI